MRGEEPTNIFLHRSNLMGSTPGGFKSRVAGRCVQWLMCLEGAFWLMEVPPQLLCFDLVLEFKCWRVWAASLASEFCFPTLQKKVQCWLLWLCTQKQSVLYTVREFNSNSEVVKGSSPTSATQIVHHPSQQKKERHARSPSGCRGGTPH